MKTFHRLALILMAFACSVAGISQQEAALKKMYDNGDYTALLAEVNSMQTLSPQVLLIKGDGEQQLGKYTAAMKSYDLASKEGLKSEARLHKAICHYNMHQYEESEVLLLDHLDEQQAHPKALYYLAAIRFMTFEQKDAIGILNDLISLDPDNMEALYLRASCYTELKKYGRAIEDYSLALKLRPDFHRTLLNIAVVNLEMNKNEDAIEYLKKLLFEDIDFHAEVFYYLAEAKYGLHDREGACEDWTEAAALGDDDAKASYQAICVNNGKKPKRRVSSGAF